MDSQYFDLYIKYKGVEQESLHMRAMYEAEINMTIKLLLSFIKVYQENHNGVSPVDYIRIE